MVSASELPRVAQAFAPGHLTGIFSPVLDATDPRGRGSVGAGLVLAAGVTARAEWHPSSRSSIRLSSNAVGPFPISEEVARRMISRRPGALRLELVHELPIGQGFGMSAAGALATALAVAPLTGHTTVHATQVAHLADLFGGGGLGGVSAILGGGLEVRERAGVPPFGQVRHYRASGSVFLVQVGRPLPSPELLGNAKFLRRVAQAAALGVARLGRRPSLRNFLVEAEQFTDALRLGPSRVLRMARRLRSTRTRVAQAMFGRSLYAVPLDATARRGLIADVAQAGVSAVEVPIARGGAEQQPVSGRSLPRTAT